jgi:hypothetical protein
MRAAAAVAAVVIVAPVSTAGAAPVSPWAAKANSVCVTWHKKGEAVLGANPAQPKTAAQWYAFMEKARPIEVGMLHGLQAIRLTRPPGATHALALAGADVHEIDVALAAYRSGHTAAFTRDAGAWITDQRASKAFAAIGAKSCA